MKELSYNDKLMKFILGSYCFRAPPVCSASWGERAWIAYIDDCGEWL